MIIIVIIIIEIDNNYNKNKNHNIAKEFFCIEIIGFVILLIGPRLESLLLEVVSNINKENNVCNIFLWDFSMKNTVNNFPGHLLVTINRLNISINKYIDKHFTDNFFIIKILSIIFIYKRILTLSINSKFLVVLEISNFSFFREFILYIYIYIYIFVFSVFLNLSCDPSYLDLDGYPFFLYSFLGWEVVGSPSYTIRKKLFRDQYLATK